MDDIHLPKSPWIYLPRTYLPWKHSWQHSPLLVRPQPAADTSAADTPAADDRTSTYGNTWSLWGITSPAVELLWQPFCGSGSSASQRNSKRARNNYVGSRHLYKPQEAVEQNVRKTPKRRKERNVRKMPKRRTERNFLPFSQETTSLTSRYNHFIHHLLTCWRQPRSDLIHPKTSNQPKRKWNETRILQNDTSQFTQRQRYLSSKQIFIHHQDDKVLLQTKWKWTFLSSTKTKTTKSIQPPATIAESALN